MKQKILFLALFIMVLSACESTPTPKPSGESDPCYEDIVSGVPEEFRRCPGNSGNGSEIDSFSGSSSCPDGCTTHKDGCDIKGNISFDSDEKIYHVPGQEFYSNTIINPDFGERWFCTEAEAEANGWRKSSR